MSSGEKDGELDPWDIFQPSFFNSIVTFIRASEDTKTCHKSYGEDIYLNLNYFSVENSVNTKQTDSVEHYKL